MRQARKISALTMLSSGRGEVLKRSVMSWRKALFQPLGIPTNASIRGGEDSTVAGC
jgi:hypothetical protein